MKNTKSIKTLVDELSLDLQKNISTPTEISNLQDNVLNKVIEILDNLFLKIEEGEILKGEDEEIESVYRRYLSLNNIKTPYENIDDFLDKVIDKVFESLKQKKVKLNYDLFERGNFIGAKNGSGEQIEFKTSQKTKLLIRVLSDLKVNFSTINTFEEKLNPKRMRKVPYIIYHIYDENINKTVLVCDQIGQATFIYDGIIDPAIFQIIEKGEEIDGKLSLKIVYSKKTYENNLKIGLSKEQDFFIKQNLITNEEEEKPDEIIENLTKEELFKTLWNYEKKTEQESYDYFMSLNNKGVKELKISGNAVKSLLKISRIIIDGNMQTPTIFQNWIDEIFKGKDIVRKERIVKLELTKEELFKTLWNYEGRTEQENYDYFMSLSQKGIVELKISGNAVGTLKNISGINIDGRISNPTIFQNWIDEIFKGKDIVRKERIVKLKLTKEELLKTLWNFNGISEQESYDYFMNLDANGIAELKISGNAVFSLKTLSGINIDGNIYTPTIFQNWIDEVFKGKDIVREERILKIELTKEELLKNLWNYEGMTEQESYDYFMSLSQKGIAELKITGNAVIALKTISGINIDGSVYTPTIFQNWIEEVFRGKDIIKKENLTKEKLLKTLCNYNGMTEQESYDYFMSLNQRGIAKLKISGNAVSKLKTISGLKIDGRILTPTIFQTWIEEIFRGKDIIRK